MDRLGAGRLIDAHELARRRRHDRAVQDIGTTGISRASRVLLTPAALVLAVGIVLVSLNAMRTGLLTRFMGALGIVVGVSAGGPVRLVAAARADLLARQPRAAVRRPPPGRRSARVAHRPRGAVAERAQLAEQRRAAAEAEAEAGGAAARPPAEPERVPAGTHPAASKRKRKRRS